MLGGMEERPLFPHYDANCIQTPTHRAVSLTVKVRPRQTARGNTLPPLLVCTETTTSDVSCPK